MEDNILKLREDLQECIADNIDTFSHCYGGMFFDTENKILKQSLGCFEVLTISPCNDKMRFDGTIAKDLDFTEQQMLEIQKQSWQVKMKKYNKKMEEKRKTTRQKDNERIIKEMKSREMLYTIKQPREPIPEEIELMFLVKRGLSHIGFEFYSKVYDEMLLLSYESDKITFNKDQLRTIYVLSDKLDFLLITPTYPEDEYSEKALGIKIAMGINLAKEE